MKTLEDIKPAENVKVLLWGQPGVGKTSLAATFPGCVFADVDHGISVVKSRDFIERFGKLDLVGYEQFDDVLDKHGLFKQAQAYWKVLEFINAAATNPDCQTIVIDSLSSLQELAMHVAVELSGAHGRSQTLAKSKLKGAGQHPVIIPTQADFGSEMSAFSQLMDQAVSIPKNLVFIAHERAEFNKSGVATKRMPLLIGSAVRARVAKWFDEVWMLDFHQKRRLLRTQSTSTIQGLKSRSLSLPDGILDPTYTIIMEAAKTGKLPAGQKAVKIVEEEVEEDGDGEAE